MPPEDNALPDPAQSASGFYQPANPPGLTLAFVTLEFELDPGDATRLLRAPALQASRVGPVRSAVVNHVWHDTADGALALQSLALCRTTGRSANWHLERLHPAAALDWLPATSPLVLAEAETPDAFDQVPHAGLAPAAAFAGKRRSIDLHLDGTPCRLDILDGVIRGVTQDRPVCRVVLTGPQARIVPLAVCLAGVVAFHIPRQSLAASAMALARNTPVRPRQLGAPCLPPGLSTTDSIASISAHLADVMLHWSDLVPQATAPEPVHQMRVAVRRLRSALSVFRRAAAAESAGADWLYDLSAALRDLAARLGTARDWDVFVAETGAEIHAAFPEDRRITLLIAAAMRKRSAAYAELGRYMASPDWHKLSLTLALLPTVRPWDTTGNPETLQALCASYAARALDRRLKQLLAFGQDLSRLGVTELHDLRKLAKRLRYATEFFAPLFADRKTRKYLPRLEHLQKVLGAVNDTAVAARLMGQLAGGADRAFAAGVVQGFGAAKAKRAASRVQRSWTRFTRAMPFWH